MSYSIRFETGNIKNGGTRAGVRLTLVGTVKDYGVHFTDQPDMFKRGARKIYQARIQSIGLFIIFLSCRENVWVLSDLPNV